MKSLARHIRAHIVGYLALFVAMGGTAYAVGANSIGDREIANNSVGSGEIQNGAVATKDLDDDDIQFCYVGQILLLGFDDFAPVGTLPADGRSLSIDSNQALYSLYGNTYGGSPANDDFNLPTLDPPAPGTAYVVCIGGIYPPRD